MQGKYIFTALVVIFLICSPVAAITGKIATGAPVFLGESNLNIGASIRDCHVIAWWPDPGNMTGPAAKNITVKQPMTSVDLTSHFNISPSVFGGYTGNWYCEDKEPHFVVLTVLEPNISIRAWDIDHEQDVTGQSVPYSANITYRIDTNLNLAMDYYNRTDLTPADGIFTVTLIDPRGKQISNIYTGNAGKTTTEILIFDGSPFIKTPVYFGKNMQAWNHLSRNLGGGDLIYPAGTYTFTVTQNLNGIQKSLAESGLKDQTGLTTATAVVTFLPQQSFAATTATTVSVSVEPTTAEMTTIPAGITETVPAATTAPVSGKATYSPVPAWIALAALGIAGIGMFRNRK